MLTIARPAPTTIIERRNEMLQGISDLIQGFHDEHFDMSMWVQNGDLDDLVRLTPDRDERGGCNTACCFAGWTVVYAMRERLILSSWREHTTSFWERSIQAKARHLLYLTERDAEPLFLPFGRSSLWVIHADELGLNVVNNPHQYHGQMFVEPTVVAMARMVGMIVAGEVEL